MSSDAASTGSLRPDCAPLSAPPPPSHPSPLVLVLVLVLVLPLVLVLIFFFFVFVFIVVLSEMTEVFEVVLQVLDRGMRVLDMRDRVLKERFGRRSNGLECVAK